MQLRAQTKYVVAVGALMLALAAGAQESDYGVKEIFVPQTSEFTQHHPLAGISSFDLSPDGKMLAVEFSAQGPDKKFGDWVALWDVGTGRLIREKQVELDEPSVLAYGSRSLPPVRAPILWYSRDICFSPDGGMLLALTGPSLVALSVPELKILYTIEDRVQAKDAESQMFIEGFSMAANRLAVLEQISHNSNQCCSLRVMVANLDNGNILARWHRPGLSRSIALSPDGNLLALTISPREWGYRNIPASQNSVFIVESDSGKVVRAFNSGYAAGDAEFLPGGMRLVTVPIDHGEALYYPRDAVKIWNLKTGELEQTFGYPKYGVRGDMSISANGKWLAVANVWLNPGDLKYDRDNTRGYARLLLWNLASGGLAYDSGNLGQEYDLAGAPIGLVIGSGRPPVLVRMSASGDRLAVGGEIISVRAIPAILPESTKP